MKEIKFRKQNHTNFQVPSPYNNKSYGLQFTD